jgi:UDPglucose 6-dehydrogenase
VLGSIERLFPHVSDDALLLISSQLPVGSTAEIERRYRTAFPGRGIGFGYSPENLRLGRALAVFQKPDRVVVGLRRDEDRTRVAAMLAPFTDRLEWMSVESAEMTKHAINAFLATSVVFANELAVLCEAVGADASEVERGLKSEARIGPAAYLGPGAAFAGGTLARDIMFLNALAQRHDRQTRLLAAVRDSNDGHRLWPQRQLRQACGEMRDCRVAIWGLTYKPGTDTLRRSSAVELARKLLADGAQVRAHDPAVRRLPDDLSGIELHQTAIDAVRGAAALVVATEWPEYRSIQPDAVVAAMAAPTVIDASGFLARTLGSDTRIAYSRVGRVSHGSV